MTHPGKRDIIARDGMAAVAEMIGRQVAAPVRGY